MRVCFGGELTSEPFVVDGFFVLTTDQEGQACVSRESGGAFDPGTPQFHFFGPHIRRSFVGKDLSNSNY